MTTAEVTIIGKQEIWLSDDGQVYARFKYSVTMLDFLLAVVGVADVKHTNEAKPSA